MTDATTTEQTTEQTAAVVVPTPMTTTEQMALMKSTFHFKTEKTRDQDGNVVGEGKKHPSLQLDLPVPSLVAILGWISAPEQHQKELELLVATMQDQVYRVARGQINDYREANKGAAVTAATLNFDKLSWTAIANMPKSERASSVPSDDEFKAFFQSYKTVMPEALGKQQKAIDNHVLIMGEGFKKQRAQKDMLELFVQFLTTYQAVAGEEAVEEHLDVIEYLTGRLEKLLKSEDKITLDDI